MIEKLFHTTLGRLFGVLAISLVTWVGTVIVGHWNTKVASPQYVNQQIDHFVGEIESKIIIREAEFNKNLLEIKIKSNNTEENLITEFQKARESNIIFQTQLTSDMSYLIEKVGEIKEDNKEVENRLRKIESGSKN